MKNKIVALIVCIVCVAIVAPVKGADEGVPRRLKVLFFGDDGHHTPLVRLRQVHSAFSQRGIDFTYTDRVADINAKNLARYDVFMVYANTVNLPKENEQALMDYVESGHGFAPIHCASYCFLNSQKYIDLVGAQFKSHTTGTFRVKNVNPDHPIMKGFDGFESWDETYVHTKHNEKDRTVLETRREGDRDEPWTWVRTQGKGRVFYTAWGHDERTWGNHGFQDLLERGLRWSAGDWAMQPQPKLKAFEYQEANLPYYVPNQPWGVQGKAINTMQKPVRPEESMKHMVIPPGFEMKLVASDPEIKKPICMAWDERGRMWISETYDYPNEMQPEGKGRDRITICEDTDGDGVADKFTVFADKLSIPTSICFANGGLIVAQAPHFLFLKDTDGDDKADVRQVLFSGWGTADTHAGPSNLRYGFDNWVYGVVGYSGFRGNVGGQQISFGSGVYRFKPDGSALEFLASTNNNTWGLALTEEGNVVGSTANNNAAFYVHIPNRYYESVRGMSARTLPLAADVQNFYPVTARVRQMDLHGKYTAGAGCALYTARSFPAEYWNRIAFINEPTGHVVGRFVVQREGANIRFRNDFNQLGSGDEWTSPIMAEVGPDGALWIIDWYNYIIQHNPTPQGFRTGKGNAYETDLRDKTHGRVYRMIYKDGKPSAWPNLAKASAGQLVETLKSDNMFWRLTAQRLLVNGQMKDAVPGLIALAGDKSVDSVGLNTTVIHALWTLHGLGAMDGTNAEATGAAVGTLAHPSAGVRKTAVEVLPRSSPAAAAILNAKLLEDGDAQVRKAALLALAECAPSDEAGAAIFSILSRKENADDKVMVDAAIAAAAHNDAGFLKAAFAAYQSADIGQPAKVDRTNLVPNPSFEEGEGNNPKAWVRRTYGGGGNFSWVDGGRTGNKCLKIESTRGGDISWSIDLPAEPNTNYRFSGWVKTENVTGAMGGLFNIHISDYKTSAVKGTSDWTRLAMDFNTGPNDRITLNCLFGGWGLSRGTVYYDDLELTKAGGASLPGTVGRVVSAVTNHYAQRGPVESIVPVLSSLKKTDARLAAVILDGLVMGWPEKVSPKLAEADVTELRSIMTALPAELRDRMISLADRWERRDLFAAELAAITKDLSAKLAAKKSSDDVRLDSARRLLAIADSAATVSAILKQVTPTAGPEVQQGLLDAVALSRNAETGKAIVAKWNQFSPAVQQNVVSILLRKAPWTVALLDGVESGSINNKDLRAQHWSQLTRNKDAQIAQRAATLEKSTGRAPSEDRKKVLDTVAPVVMAKKGDVVKGQAVFQTNCAVCHTIEGQGGKVGPELTGVGARPKHDILIEVLDPNRSVEGTYRQWTVETRDEILYGRLLTESKTTIEIIDAAGKTRTIDRKDISVLSPSDRSVMPEGFEQTVSADDLASLLEFLGTSKVKH